MTSFWILILIFITMYKVQPGRRWVTAQSLTESVYQPDKELSVNIGDSATLRCCIAENAVGIITWFKQINREKPQLMVRVYKNGGEVFYTGFQKSRFQIERSSNCFSMTFLNIIQSDEAMYYCAVTVPNFVFGDGTYLKIKGEHVTITSETPKPALSDNSVVCEPTLHGNNTNMNTQENTGHSTGKSQESEAESLNYAALQFSKKKAKAGKRKPGSSDECVYSDVTTTVRYNIVDS
ncbi:uncharacterized protein LOC131357745 isoform X3 [Hemibagrus wyckioides]|uniref:uncharacterized protein LOC131357745 isoform X3 n=1 Tax=Hemibagrus wyckioides TaxID=337641 RepID=UPI00266C1C81|nr:uncharacterized protein LOC131357745 isoform X3 [Hemibagrus wyckioides]